MKNGYATISQYNNALVLENEQTIDYHKCSLSVSFVRTLRIPDNNQKYNLPPGLGNFPLKHVEDYPKVPEHWQTHGGVFLPMYQSEAMWLKFNCQWPFAIKIAAGKINAVSGEEWSPELKSSVAHVRSAYSHEDLLQPATIDNPAIAYQADVNAHKKEPKFDYLVAPTQPWLDGFNVGKGLVRQFVAMPLGDGYTVEEQLTGKAEVGGLQIIAYPMKKEFYERILEERKRNIRLDMSGAVFAAASASLESCAVQTKSLRSRKVEMGLGAGGFMKQEIYEDKYGIEAWDMENPIRVFVHLVNSEQYTHITGEAPPSKPVGPEVYKQYNYPWFDYYSDGKALEGSDKLAKVDSVGSIDVKQGKDNFAKDNQFVQPTPHVIGKKTVKNGKW